MKTVYTRLIMAILIGMGSSSCQKKDTAEETSYLRRYWNETASSNYEVPATRATEIKAKCFLNLMTDNIFWFDILLDTTFREDELTGAALYTGSPVSKGTLFADLKPAINGRHLSGSIQLTKEQADQLMAQPLFLNVRSKLSTEGLVRLQLDKNIDWCADVPLSGGAVVPSVATNTTGKAILRITTDKVLHYQLIVDGVGAGDQLLEAHLHEGAVTANGAQRQVLASTTADYNTVKALAGLADNILEVFKSKVSYIDVHSASYPGGLLRGQLR